MGGRDIHQHWVIWRDEISKYPHPHGLTSNGKSSNWMGHVLHEPTLSRAYTQKKMLEVQECHHILHHMFHDFQCKWSTSSPDVTDIHWEEKVGRSRPLQTPGAGAAPLRKRSSASLALPKASGCSSSRPSCACNASGEGEKCGNFLDSGEKHICEHVYM